MIYSARLYGVRANYTSYDFSEMEITDWVSLCVF